LKKRIAVFLIIFVLFSSIKSVYAIPNCGLWSVNHINSALANGIINHNADFDYYSPITRKDIADVIASAYRKISGNTQTVHNSFFTDISNDNIATVSELGIMTGYGDGTFMPSAYTSRQEMSKIILTYQSVLLGEQLVLPEEYSCSFTDFNELSEWAKPYVAKATYENLITGYEDGKFSGLTPVSWQEAIVLIDRVSPFNKCIDLIQPEKKDMNLDVQINDGTAEILWDGTFSVHTLTITEQRLSRYEGDIPPDEPMSMSVAGTNSLTFETNPNKKYIVKISGNSEYDLIDFTTPKYSFEDMMDISSTYPTTEEEAEKLMIDVTVPVWQMKNNDKVAASISFKVHNQLAEKVKLIFEEIFNGPEKFPIKDIGCYSWRGGTSEHNGGTAIDINSNENYCIYNDGTTIGSYWKPHEDPYSITPYGDVIKAFEKYGFTWGGDSWSNPKDYMHFSYLGT